jgi:hypothetical protein
MRKAWIVVACGLAVAACTKQASQVVATSASPIAYDSYSCPRLVEEALSVSSRAAQATGAQDQNAANDKMAMAAGLIIFWPELSPPKGYDTSTAELARIKGQMDAIEQASAKNKCSIAFRPAPSTEPPAATTNREFH